MKQSLSVSALVASFVLLLGYMIIDFEWDFYDSFNAHLLSGIATRGVVKDFYIVWPFIPRIYIFLQKSYGNFLWFGVTFYFFLFFANTVFALLAIDFFKRNFPYISFLKLFCAFFALLFCVQIVSVSRPSITGVSFLLCGSSILLVEVFFTRLNSLAKKTSLYLLVLFMFFWGACFRIDSAVAATIVVGIYIVLSSVNLKQSLLKAFPILCLLVILFSINAKRISRIPFLKETELALFYLGDGVNKNNLYSGLSERDSMKAYAVNRFYLNDENELTISFIKGLVQKKLSAEKVTGINLFKRCQTAWQIAAPTILSNWHYLFLNSLSLFLVFHINNNNKFRILSFQILFWCVVFFVAYLAKLEDRHYLYMAQLFTYCNLLLLFQPPNRKLLGRKIMYPIIASISFLFCFLLIKTISGATVVNQNLENLSATEQEINRLAENKILLLDGDSKNIYHGPPFTIRRFETPQEIIYYDMGHLPLLPEYNIFLNNLCGCNSRNVVEFYNYLQENKGRLLIVSNDWRMTFTQSYLRVVHNKQFHYRKILGNFAVQKIQTGTNTLNYYEILD